MNHDFVFGLGVQVGFGLALVITAMTMEALSSRKGGDGPSPVGLAVWPPMDKRYWRIEPASAKKLRIAVDGQEEPKVTLWLQRALRWILVLVVREAFKLLQR